MPSRASNRFAFLRASWRHLVMLSYDIDPGVLQPLLPLGTELDLWQGQTLVTVVGFRFLETRLLGVPVPFHRNFDEINLRFYVRRRVNHTWRSGVVFIREVVARPAIAQVARLIYNEPYLTLPTRHDVHLEAAKVGAVGSVAYHWFQDRWYTVEAETQGGLEPLQPGSDAEFVAHREWGYTRQRDGTTLEYEVRHPRWSVWATRRSRLDCDIDRMYGRAFVAALTAPPVSAIVAQGSPVEVYRGSSLTPP